MLEISLTTILNIAWVIFILITFVYGQQIQLSITMQGIRKKLKKLERMKNDARSTFISALSKFSSISVDRDIRVDRLLEFFAIAPVTLDPKGVVWKLEHIINSYESKLKSEITTLVPSANESEVNTLSNLLEVSLELNTIFRVVRHFYLAGKKSKNLFTIMQLQMVLPIIMEQAETYHSSLQSFVEGKPIGDGIGPLVAAKLIDKMPTQEIVKDTIVSEVEINQRKTYIVKAKGPGGNLGKPGEAIKQIIEKNKKISMIIMVDAGVKLEGETSGEIASGVGAAIGGSGVERYKIEEIATEHNLPLYAFVVKMSEKEAITTIKKEICEAAEQAVNKVKEIISEKTREKESVIIAGIGNTLGIV